jgi:hypothetical protein
MSQQDDADIKRRKIKTLVYLLVTVVALYLTVILKEW